MKLRPRRRMPSANKLPSLIREYWESEGGPPKGCKESIRKVTRDLLHQLFIFRTHANEVPGQPQLKGFKRRELR
ncbi:hypothetical protein TNCV_1373991 [Trichonephila clavipes]|nr:hypothetical protein TNCV_1373991 [Trichonephila clavipes]